MGILKSIYEGLSVKNLISQFYTGYQQVSPGNSRVEKVMGFAGAINSKYNMSIANSFSGSGDPRQNTLANMLANIYSATYKTKKELFELYRSVKDTDQASAIIDDFIDDAMNTTNSEFPFTIKLKGNLYNTGEIELKLQEFIKKFDIYQLDHDTSEDFLVYGDYYFSTIPKIGEGIIDIADNVEIENVFSIYKNNQLEQHIGMNKNSLFANSTVSGYAGQLQSIHRDLLSHFILDTRKIKIALPIEGASILTLPENIRIGRSILHSSIQLLKKYQLLDIALTYKEVRNALMPVLLGISTGAFTTPDNMIEAAKAMESYLSEGTAMDFNLDNYDSIEGLLYGTSNFKVAPIPGDRGQLSKIDSGTSYNETEGLSNILNNTAARINRVSGGVSQDETGKSRLEILKGNSRRSKRLIDIQRGKATGWRDMFHKNLRYQHINIEKENIMVNYKAIPNADVFEEANGVITLLSVINDLQIFSDSVNQSNSGYKVNPKKMVEAFDLYVGNRYQVLKGFLELDVVKNQFPAATDALKQLNKTQVGYSGQPEKENPMNTDSSITSGSDLQKMNKAFNGSSGSSDAVGQ